MTSTSPRRYRRDLLRALVWAAIVLPVAVAALAVVGVRLPAPGGRWLALPAAALVAAVLVSGVVFGLRRLRGNAMGWILSGAAVAVAVAVPAGGALAALYDPVGVQLFGVPREAAAAWLPRAAFAVVLVGAGIGGYLGYREHTGASVF